MISFGHVLRIALLIVALSALNLVWSEELEVDFSGDSRIKMLKQAGNDDYKVSILSGKVSGVVRTVVLLGEFHVKNAVADKVGREIISAFPLRGLESYYPNSTLSTLAMVPGHLTVTLLHKMLSLLVDRPFDSTISACMENVEGETLITIKPDDHETADKVNIILEAGGSDLLLVASINMLPAMMLNPAARIVPVTNKIISNNYMLNLFSMYLFVQLSRFVFGGLEELHPYYFPFQYWIITYRNQLMVDNVIKVFNTRKDSQEMLVVTGKSHVAGMSELLMKHYGFSDLTNQVLSDVETNAELGD